MQQGYNTGNIYFGDLATPVGNRRHTSQTGNAFTNPNVLCKNCHEVWVDLDHDGIEEKGIDLVLQETWDEYQDSRTSAARRPASRATCPRSQASRASPTALRSPTISTRSPPIASFTITRSSAPTTSWTTPRRPQRQLAARTKLLQSAAAIQFDRNSFGADGNGEVGVDVLIANIGVGHNLPTGFAFARQMWLEITSVNAAGTVVDSSGLLADPTDDLCDGATLDDNFFNPMPQFFQNCRFIDGELTTFQQKLVSVVNFEQQDRFLVQDTITQDVQDNFGFETWLQYLSGGVVARQRFSENGNLAALLPFETREFHYDLQDPGQGGKMTARLLYRSLPPYFLRALASKQAATEESLTPLISNLDILVLATDQLDF